MRGLKSTLALDRRARRARRLHLFRHLEEAGGRRGSDDAKKRRRCSRRCRPTRSTSSRSSTDGGDVDDAEEGRRRVEDHAAVASCRRRRVRSVAADRRRSASVEIVRVIDENPSNLNDYGLSNPRVEVDFKAAGRQGLPQAARRRQVADRRRSLRQAQRREEGLPDSGGAGHLVQPHDVRPARQDAAEVRARQGRRARRHRRRQDAGDRQGRRRVEDLEAGADQGRLRLGRRAGRTPADGADEVDRRRQRDRRPI